MPKHLENKIFQDNQRILTSKNYPESFFFVEFTLLTGEGWGFRSAIRLPVSPSNTGRGFWGFFFFSKEDHIDFYSPIGKCSQNMINWFFKPEHTIDLKSF